MATQMEAWVAEVERALRARGISGRRASLEAVGNPELVRRLRRGQVPTVERLAALCDVLSLEMYIGPQRDPAPVDERRLELAVETVERALEATGRPLGHAERARVIASIYVLIGNEGSAAANAARVRKLVRTVTDGMGG